MDHTKQDIWPLIDEYYDLLDMTSIDDFPYEEQEFLADLVQSNDKDNIIIAVSVLKSKPRCTRHSIRLSNKKYIKKI